MKTEMKTDKMADKTGKKNEESVVVFSAHSDDFVLGAGGTIAKYVQEGKKVTAVVFSYGEKSHPWLKKRVVQDMRLQEAQEASKLLGCRVLFFDLTEFNFLESYRKKKKEKVILRLLSQVKPEKIFTHSPEDPHPDHRAVQGITFTLLKRYEKQEKKPEVYVYSIWNPVSFQTGYPALYVDVSPFFSQKLRALRSFRSQQLHIIYPLLVLLFHAVKDGLKIKKKFAEKFLRIA